MSWSTACAALKTAFTTGWGSTTPILFENVSTQPGFGPFVFFETIGAGARLISGTQDGARLYEDDGVVLGHVYVPRASGGETCRALADQFAALFRGKLIPDGSDTVQCFAPTIGPAAVEGAWMRITCSAPFVARYYA